MNEEIIKEFKKACKENRTFLGYSYKQMASYLDNVTEKEYDDFENKEGILSKDNLKRVIRILCISKPGNDSIDVNQYIDTNGLTKEQIDYFAKIIRDVIGE